MTTKMKLAAAVLAAASFGAIGCDRNETASTSTPNTAANDARTATNNAATEGGSTARNAGDATGNAVTDAINKVDNTVGAKADAPGHGGSPDTNAQAAGARVEGAANDASNAARDAAGNAADATRNAANNATDAVRAQGNTARDQNDARSAGDATPAGTSLAPGLESKDTVGIHETLIGATEAFVKEGTVDDLTERFVDADRNRIGDQDNNATADAVKKFRAAWKEKYNADFDIDTREIAGVTLKTGEIADAARTAAGVDAPNTNAADANRNDPGRQVATATFPSQAGMGELQVPLIREAMGAWKIDVADSVDGNKFKQNLTNSLNKLEQNKAQWPADANQAYSVVAHELMMALMDKQAM